MVHERSLGDLLLRTCAAVLPVALLLGLMPAGRLWSQETALDRVTQALYDANVTLDRLMGERKYDEALALARETSERYEPLVSYHAPRVAQGLLAMVQVFRASILEERGEYQEAYEFLREAWRRLRCTGESHPMLLGRAALSLGTTSFRLQRYRDADLYAQRALEHFQRASREAPYPALTADTIVAYRLAIQVVHALGHIDNGLELAERALAFVNASPVYRNNPANYLTIARIHGHAADSLAYLGHYSEAIEHAERGLQLLNSIGNRSAAVVGARAKLLYDKSRCYRQLQQLDLARQASTQAIRQLKLLPDTYSEKQALSVAVYGEAAAVALQAANYAEALEHSTTLVKCLNTVERPDLPLGIRVQMLCFHAEAAALLAAAVSPAMGRDLAETATKQWYEVRNNVQELPPSLIPGLAAAAKNLAFAWKVSGYSGRSCQLLEDAASLLRLSPIRKGPPPAGVSLASLQHDLAVEYANLGDLSTAKIFLDKAIQNATELQRSYSQSPRSTDRVVLLAQRVVSCLWDGDVTTASALVQQLYEAGHPIPKLPVSHARCVAQLTRHVALAALATGDVWAAEALASALLREITSTSGAPVSDSLLMDLKLTYYCLACAILLYHRDFPGAVAMAEQAVARALTPDFSRHSYNPSISRVMVLSDAALAYAAVGDYRRAWSYLRQCCLTQLADAPYSLLGWSDAQLLCYHRQLQTDVSSAIHLGIRAHITPSEIHRLLLAFQGWMEDVAYLRRSLPQRAAEAGVARVYNEYMTTRKRLADLSWRCGQLSAITDPRLSPLIAMLAARKEELEKVLTPALRQQPLPLWKSADPETVPPRSTIIDFALSSPVHFQGATSRPPDKPRFVAFVYSSYTPTQVVELPPRDTVAQRLAQWLGASSTQESYASACWVREHLWKPIQSAIPNDTRVLYIRPVDLLCYVPWYAIPCGQSEQLIDRYSIALVGSTRRCNRHANRLRRTPPPNWRLLFVSGDALGRAADAVSNAQPSWAPIPGALEELATIASLVPTAQLQPLTGRRATPASVLQGLASATHVHVAAHGFMRSYGHNGYKEMPRGFANEQPWISGPAIYPLLPRNPFLLTGIALPIESGESGTPVGTSAVLAEAIAGMDLSELELVVMTTCWSGSGPLPYAQQPASLQKAFVIAGAREVVAPLWQIRDASAATFTKAFYEGVVRHGLTPVESTRLAALALRKASSASTRGRGPKLSDETAVLPDTNAPYLGDWAAFTIAVGCVRH